MDPLAAALDKVGRNSSAKWRWPDEDVTGAMSALMLQEHFDVDAIAHSHLASAAAKARSIIDDTAAALVGDSARDSHVLDEARRAATLVLFLAAQKAMKLSIDTAIERNLGTLDRKSIDVAATKAANELLVEAKETAVELIARAKERAVPTVPTAAHPATEDAAAHGQVTGSL
jgi:hypothetical protein